MKSNVQFSKDQAPADFVSSAWEQFLHEVTTCFEKTHDNLSLIITPPNASLQDEIEGLLTKACSQNAHSLKVSCDK